MKLNKKIITDYEMLEALIQNIPDSIYFKDSQSRFIKVNKFLVNRLKASDELEVIGKTDFDFFTKEHAEKAFNDEQKIVKIGIPVVNKEEKETYENGEDKWVSTTKMPFKNKEGKIIGIFGISRDITVNKKIRKDLRAAKIEAERYAKKARQADKAKSTFLANMSHEIRTPMNAIMGFSEILREQLKNPEYIKYIDIILSSSKTLLALINDILDISKIEAGKMEIQLRPTDPHALFSDIARIFSEKMKEKGLGFITEIDERLPDAILLDEVRLRQILFNLVGNAIKFTSEGYIELKVKGKFYPDRSKIDLIFS
ncbi:MAG: PAS domain-containing protein, partial [Actinobacteria bacterium]|nr:PAS domain-containing protein [Actinomycetota bacterium]